MKNTMCPSPSTTTATTALALSLLQAPALPAVQGADVAPASSSTNLSHVESALIHGSAADAVKIIDASALKDLRPEVVEKEMVHIVERVVKDLMLQGKVDDAQRVVRTVRALYPESARRGILRAFATLDTESFEKFCDQSLIHGVKPHDGLKKELNTISDQHPLPPATSAQMLNVMDRVDASRAKTQVAMEVGAITATGIAAVSGAASSRSFLARAVQVVGGAAAAFSSWVVFCSLLGHSMSLVSFESLGLVVSGTVAVIAGQQVLKGLGFIDQD